MNEVPDTFGSLFIGYTVIWGILAAYIFFMVGKVRSLEKRLGAANLNSDKQI